MRASDATIRTALGEIFADAPDPRPVDELAETLVDQGLDMGGDPEDRLRQALQLDARFADVEDGLVFVPALLEGTCWTAAVDAEEAREDFVRLQPHLPVLTWWLVEGGVALVDDAGERLGELETDGVDLDGVDTDVLLGPDGWLEPFAGGLASVEVIGGALRWTPCDVEPGPTTAQVEAVRRGFERAARDESFSDMTLEEAVALMFAVVDGTMREALVVDRRAFVDDPVPRLDTLLAAAGLERQRAIVAPAGFDWDQLATWQRRQRSKWEYGLDDEGAEQLSMLIGACDLVLGGDPDALGTDEGERGGGAALLAAILEANEDVATAFWTSRSEDLPLEELLRFADALVGELGEATPGVAWLRARSLDALGRVPEAIEALDAVVADSTHPLVLIDAAGFAADRGDAPTARRLLERAGADDHLREHDGEFTHSSPDLDLLAEVLPFAQRPRAVARRNDPCPCGSGKKYKACHLGSERHPLDLRAGWLYDKAVRHLRRDDPQALADLAREMAGDLGWTAERQLAEAPPLIDLALHEGGGFADFLFARSDLLPDDEALLAAQWQLVDRGVYEIERVGQGRLELRDVGRGERLTVTGVEFERTPRPGTALVGRPLPVGDTHRAFGGFLPVPPHAVRDLLDAIDEGDASGIAAAIAATMGMPGLSNSDGEPMVFHEVRWQLPDGTTDAGSVGDVLEERGLERMDGSETPTWTLVRDTANQPRAVIATLRLEDGQLVGEVNSDRRAQEMRELVEDALPAATVVAEDHRPVEEALRDRDPGEAPGDQPDMDDPAVQEVLREMMRQHEVRWLDEEIPALGGRTPREAVDDPVGRVEVLQLLASFPGPDERGIGMDPARIRSMLGL